MNRAKLHQEVRPWNMEACVYRCFDGKDRLIYVGCSQQPTFRLAAHGAASWWYPQIHRITVQWFPRATDALNEEGRAIHAEDPRWNITGRYHALREHPSKQVILDYLFALEMRDQVGSKRHLTAQRLLNERFPDVAAA